MYVCVSLCVILCNLSGPYTEPVITPLAYTLTHTNTLTHLEHHRRMCLTIGQAKEISAKQRYPILQIAKVTNKHSQSGKGENRSSCDIHIPTVTVVNNCCVRHSHTVD